MSDAVATSSRADVVPVTRRAVPADAYKVLGPEDIDKVSKGLVTLDEEMLFQSRFIANTVVLTIEETLVEATAALKEVAQFVKATHDEMAKMALSMTDAGRSQSAASGAKFEQALNSKFVDITAAVAQEKAEKLEILRQFRAQVMETINPMATPSAIPADIDDRLHAMEEGQHQIFALLSELQQGQPATNAIRVKSRFWRGILVGIIAGGAVVYASHHPAIISAISSHYDKFCNDYLKS